MENRIILCCIKPTIDSLNIDELSIYNIFKEHAHVKNIKIFSRCEIIKAFIEIDCQSVDQIIKAIHMQNCEIGQLSVYLSHKDSINFETDIHTLINKKSINTVKETQLGHNDSEAIDRKCMDLAIKESYPSPNYLCNSLNSLHQIDLKQDAEILPEKQLLNINDYNNLQDINKKKKITHSLKINSMGKYDDDDFKENNEQILKIQQLNINKVNCLMLLNLFECFGNVKRVLINSGPVYSLVEMETRDQAHHATNCLNGVLFFNKEFKISFYNEKTSILEIFAKKTSSNVEYMEGSSNYFKHSKALTSKVNKISKLLNIMSAPPEFSNYQVYKLISQLHEPSRILNLTKYDTNIGMFLVEFNQINQAIETLSIFNGKQVEGKNIEISFSDVNFEDIEKLIFI